MPALIAVVDMDPHTAIPPLVKVATPGLRQDDHLSERTHSGRDDLLDRLQPRQRGHHRRPQHTRAVFYHHVTNHGSHTRRFRVRIPGPVVETRDLTRHKINERALMPPFARGVSRRSSRSVLRPDGLGVVLPADDAYPAAAVTGPT
jgi:hypothetical protein